jgi:hypothetical protein
MGYNELHSGSKKQYRCRNHYLAKERLLTAPYIMIYCRRISGMISSRGKGSLLWELSQATWRCQGFCIVDFNMQPNYIIKPKSLPFCFLACLIWIALRYTYLVRNNEGFPSFRGGHCKFYVFTLLVGLQSFNYLKLCKLSLHHEKYKTAALVCARQCLLR